MDRGFWSEAWQAGRTGFHRDSVHPELISHLDQLVSASGECVLVPLCGKSLDLRWLVSQGHEVVGVEWVRQAVIELFDEEEPERASVGPYEAWRSPGLSVLHGDVFSLELEHLSRRPTVVWDRASLVAVAPERRAELVDVIRRVVAPGGRVLLNVFDYEQGEMSGPPFAVSEAEVRRLYAGCGLALLRRADGRALFSRSPDDKLSRLDIDTWLVELP